MFVTVMSLVLPDSSRSFVLYDRDGITNLSGLRGFPPLLSLPKLSVHSDLVGQTCLVYVSVGRTTLDTKQWIRQKLIEVYV